MSLLAPDFLERLRRYRLDVVVPIAGRSMGERASGISDTGIEFAEHRAYEAGDDLRSVDPHVYGRSRQQVVRKYVGEQGLRIALLLDGSESMSFGEEPTKLRRGAEIGAMLAAAAVHGGDQPHFGIVQHARISWYPEPIREPALPRLFTWLQRQVPNGIANLQEALGQLQALPVDMVVIISDWLEHDTRFFSPVARCTDMVVVHVVTPEEIDPGLLGFDALTLVDSETMERIDLLLDRKAVEQYRADHRAWRDSLQGQVARASGRYLLVRTDDDLIKVTLAECIRIRLLL